MSNDIQYNKDLQFIDKIDRMLSRRMDYAAYIFGLAACLAAHVMYIILFHLCGVRGMVIFNIFSILFYVSTLFLARVVKEKIYLIYATIVEIVLHATAATIFVGLASNFVMFLLMIIPLAFLMPHKNSKAPFVILFISVPLYGILNFYYSDPARVLYDLSDTHYEIVFYVINFIIGSLVLFFTAIIFTILNIYAETRLRVQTEQLKILASTDPLTKLDNRREIQKMLNDVSEACIAGGPCYIIGIGDIDDFKNVNDTYGHDMGDEVITGVAEIIRSTLPGNCGAARWGGEEFLFIIPESDIDEGRKCADSIIEAIRRRRFTCEGKDFFITMTIGICLGTSEDTVDKVISVADSRLYNGKHNGKNHTEYS